MDSSRLTHLLLPKRERHLCWRRARQGDRRKPKEKSVDQRRAEEEKEEEEDNQSAIAATAIACVLRRAPRHCARTGVFLNPGR